MKQKQNENGNKIGKVLKLLRIVQDLSVKDLASRMQVSSSYISDVEAYRKNPSLDMLERYSIALGVKTSTLLYFNEQGKNNGYDHKGLLLAILQRMIKKENNLDETELL